MTIRNCALITVIAALLFLWAGPVPAEEEKAWIVAAEKKNEGYDLSGFFPDHDVAFSFGDERFTLDKDPLRKADTVWAPVRLLLQKMQIMFLGIDDETFSVIREDGMPLTLKVGDRDIRYRRTVLYTVQEPPAVFDGEVFMSMDALVTALEFSYQYDAATNTVTISRKKFEELSTFELPKPKVEVEAVPKPEIQLKPHEPTDIREEERLPLKYFPDIRLKADTNLSYLLSKTADDRVRQAEWYISGKAFDYTVDGHFRLRDLRSNEKERFKEDGEFLGLYKENIWFKFLDNNVAIPQLRSQSQSYFGIEMRNFYKPFNSTFVYGEMDNTVSGPTDIGAVRYFGDLYSLRQEYTHPNDLFRTAGTFVFIESEAETQGKSSTTIYPRQNLIFITDNTVNLYDGLKLEYAQGFSSFRPDNKVNSHFRDTDWRVGLNYIQDLYSFTSSYERVGEQYASLSVPSTYQDYEGWDFSTSYKMADNWTVNAGGRLTKNNVERNPRDRTSFDKSVSGSSSLSLPARQTISVGYTVTETSAKGGDQDLSASRYDDTRIDYIKGWGNMNIQLSFDHYALHPFAASIGSGMVSDLCSASIFNFYPSLRGSYLRLYESYRKTKTLSASTYTTEYYDTTVGGRYNMLDCLSFNADWRVSTTCREAFTDTATMTLIVGGEFKESPVTTFNVDFTLSNYDLYDQKTWLPKDYTVLFRLRHVFDLTTPEKWGKVSVFVYRDMNSNGKHDKGEPGIPDVRVYVVNGRAAYTGPDGIALIDKVVPGKRQARLDTTKLPIALSVRGQAVQPITVAEFKTVKVEYPIVKTGTIKGRVFLDKDGNGKYNKLIDEALPNIRVFITPESRDTLTFSDGTYLFDYAYPGDYQVCVDLRNVPSGYNISSPEKVQVSLHEGDVIDTIDFVFNPRPVKIEVFE